MSGRSDKAFVRQKTACFLWRKLLLLVTVGLFSGWATADTYAYRNDVFAYDAPSGSAPSVTWHTTKPAPACTGYPDGDDDWADMVFPSGFSFTFGGANYAGVRIYSNGILAFGPDVSGFHRDYGPQVLPAPAGSTYSGCPTAAPVKIMLPYWIDIVAGTANSTAGASVNYELLGTAPNRRMVISWANVKLYNNTTRYNFQVALYESAPGVNGNFRFQYTSGSSDGANATVGVQLNQTDFTQYSFNQRFIDTTNGTSILWYPANQLATKSAEYRFDEGVWVGDAGEVKDTSGVGQDASRVGLAANVANGALCRGGSFTANTANAIIDAVVTPVVPGNSGSIDFWFNSNVAWNSGVAMLLDATAVANRPFFLMKTATGALTFRVTDSVGTSVTATAPAKTFALNTWHHVGVTWNVRVGTNQTALQIFVDGVLQNGAPTRGTTNGFMPALSSLAVGDNRTTGITPTGGSPNGANGRIDEAYIYPIEISAPQVTADMNLTRPICTSLDHFQIVHDGAVSSCDVPASITITAHDATHALFSLAGSTITLSTTPARGTWSNVSGGAINPLMAIGAGTGTARYTFANESSVTFGLSNTLSESLNINVALGGITEHTGVASTCSADDYTTGTTCDASRTFICAKPIGFNCVQSGAAPLTGNLFTKLAGSPFAFDVVALKDSDNDGEADTVETAYASDADKSVTVELVDGSGTTACASRAVISPAVSQTLTFAKADQSTELGRKAVASLTVANAYPDLRCRVTDANQSPSIVGCSSDDFSVRPAAITLITTATAAAPPSGTAAANAPIVKAGANFTLQATTSAGTNYTGTLTLDTSKLTAQTPGQVATVQSGGAVGALTPTTLVTNPATLPTNNATYGEVGYLYLGAGAYYDAASPAFTAVDSGNGDCIAGSFSDTLPALPAVQKYGCNIGNVVTVPLGRFVPDHFDTAIAATVAPVAPIACPIGINPATGLAWACPVNASGVGGLVYANQPFTVLVTAKNSTGGITQNYTGSFAKETKLSAWNSRGADSAITTNANPGGGTLSGAAPVFTSGVASVADSRYGTTLPALLAPTDVYFRAAEATGGDGVTSRQTTPANSVEAGLKVASGRIRIPNVYGSEKLALPMVFTVQYYSSSNQWVTSATDSTTSFNSALSPTGNLTASMVTGPANCISVNNPATAAVSAGVRTISLAATSACSYNISLADTPTYLPINPATGGRATFGIFKSPLIYRRENY